MSSSSSSSNYFSPSSVCAAPLPSSTYPWGTWEDLLLASAVLKHGIDNWSTVSCELQARAFLVPPSLFSAEVPLLTPFLSVFLCFQSSPFSNCLCLFPAGLQRQILDPQWPLLQLQQWRYRVILLSLIRWNFSFAVSVYTICFNVLVPTRTFGNFHLACFHSIFPSSIHHPEILYWSHCIPSWGQGLLPYLGIWYLPYRSS